MLAASGDAGLWFLNSHVRIAVSGDSNSDGICLIEHLMPFGEAPPLHVHHEEDELFHLLEGEILFEVGGRRALAGAGETLLAPRGIPHGFRVVSAGGARCLTVTRGGFEAVVCLASRPATAAVLPEPAELGEAELARLASLFRSHRIELIGPPLA